ncbi:Oxidoreductase FAD/NAD(P)-binding, partial [Trinorchestia longiramus]
DHYTSFELTEIEQVSWNSYVFTFGIQNNGCLRLNVGQHIILQQKKENGFTISRQYTPISSLNERGQFKVLIKLYEKGSMSELVKKWEVGDMIPWRGPFGNFLYTRNMFKKLLLLGAGTGIAPLYQVIQHVLNDGEDETLMTLLYSSKSFSDMLLRNELLEYSRYWNFDVRHFLS